MKQSGYSVAIDGTTSDPEIIVYYKIDNYKPSAEFAANTYFTSSSVSPEGPMPITFNGGDAKQSGPPSENYDNYNCAVICVAK